MMSHTFPGKNSTVIQTVKCCLLPGLLAFLACSFLRLQEATKWRLPELHIDNEPLMATHDAYAWMAGAIGTGLYNGYPMSELLRFLYAVTGAPLGVIGFWLPSFMAPFVVFPLAFLCAWWRKPEAGIIAGIITGSAFGFLFRTRLGYGDADILTLLLPLCFAAGVIALLSMIIADRWQIESKYKPSTLHFWAGSVAVGLVAWTSHWFYQSGDVIILSFLVIAFTLSFILSRREDRQLLLGGFAIVVGFWLAGWLGILPALIALWFLKKTPSAWKKREGWILLGSVCFLLLLNGQLYKFWHEATYRLFWYARWTTTIDQSIILPNRMLSVREAQVVDWTRLFSRIGVHWAFFSAGILGYILLIRKRPLALVLLPLLLLSLASIKLGNRFTMYGAPVVGIGLGFFVSFLLEKTRGKRLFVWAVHLLIAGGVVATVLPTALQLRPSPVLPKAYAEALITLKSITPEDAQLWQWWDYGYAAQYYAERWTMDDGARQEGLYPLALVHTTSSPLQASQIMKFCANEQQKQLSEMEKNGTKPRVKGSIKYYSVDPLLSLKNFSEPASATAYVRSLATNKKEWPTDLPPQYLIFSWENMKLAYWISFFGNWDLETGMGTPGRIQPLTGELSLDLHNGTVQTGTSQISLNGVSMVGEKGTKSRSWTREDGLYLVINQLSSEAYLMDRSIFESMMVQMLLGDPEEFTPYFVLVEDRYPWVRAYLVK